MGINFGGVLVWSLVVRLVMIMLVEVVQEVKMVRIGGAIPIKTNSITNNKNSNNKKTMIWTIEQETLI